MSGCDQPTAIVSITSPHIVLAACELLISMVWTVNLAAPAAAERLATSRLTGKALSLRLPTLRSPVIYVSPMLARPRTTDYLATEDQSDIWTLRPSPADLQPSCAMSCSVGCGVHVRADREDRTVPSSGGSQVRSAEVDNGQRPGVSSEEAGRHARSAVGQAALPFETPVEIEAEAAIK